jgi:hypothetical protein
VVRHCQKDQNSIEMNPTGAAVASSPTLAGDADGCPTSQANLLLTMVMITARRSPGRICFLFAHGHIQGWWSQTGSNRRPQACKASALPTELWPQSPDPTAHLPAEPRDALVGLERFELSTSRLSSARSNQLSYRPGKRECCVHAKEERRRRRCPAL